MKTSSKKVRESDIEKHLKKVVKAHGGQVRKVRWIAHRGAPDRLVWLPEMRYPELIELKRPGKSLELYQVREHIRLTTMGFQCFKFDTKAQIDGWERAWRRRRNG